ncbi:MAG: hypothetical protein F6K39_47920 [Okeania sp. SIO3B3]|nr:hypothetical protein [Okeania sp. SIO3B3]
MIFKKEEGRGKREEGRGKALMPREGKIGWGYFYIKSGYIIPFLKKNAISDWVRKCGKCGRCGERKNRKNLY